MLSKIITIRQVDVTLVSWCIISTAVRLFIQQFFSGLEQSKYWGSSSLSQSKALYLCPNPSGKYQLTTDSPHNWPVMRVVCPFYIIIIFLNQIGALSLNKEVLRIRIGNTNSKSNSTYCRSNKHHFMAVCVDRMCRPKRPSDGKIRHKIRSTSHKVKRAIMCVVWKFMVDIADQFCLWGDKPTNNKETNGLSAIGADY